MFLLTSILIFVSAECYCYAAQTLKCEYTPENKGLPKVWCKQDANNHSCCTGFAFSSVPSENQEVIMNEDDGSSFTVTVKSLPQGDGVYWCGLVKTPNVIIKLNEQKIYNPMDLVWSIMRWLFLAGLLVAVISAHVCCRGTKEKE